MAADDRCDWRNRHNSRVVRSRADGSDWFVWWRRALLTNTEGTFAGVAPSAAGLADWQRVFGFAEQVERFGCADLVPASATGVDIEFDSIQAVSSARNSFVGLKPTRELPVEDAEGDESTRLRFKEKDTLVSEFVPLYPGGGDSRRKWPLALYGLTTHGCSVPGDNSSCLAEIEIDPSSPDPQALYEPYVAYDTRCISEPNHRLYADAKDARGVEKCDRYRNFNHAPFIVSRDGRPELAWVRRGNSIGAGYEATAMLRRAPRRDSTDRGDLSGQRDNFDTFALDGYSELLEPSAFIGEAGEALVSVVEGGSAWHSCLELNRFKPRNIDEFKDKISEHSDETALCIGGLDKSWLERPWRLMADGTMLFFRTGLIHVAAAGEDENDKWDVHLEVASVDARAAKPSAHVAPSSIIGSIYVCDRSSHDLRRGDARWVLRTGDCSDYSNTEMARGRDSAKQSLAAARIMRSAPIAVADINGDTLPDIGVLLPGEGYDVTILRGRKDAGVLTWANSPGRQVGLSRRGR